MQYELTRDVSRTECHWLERDYKKGEKVFKYSGHCYGCISYNGMACSEKKDETPFFELPNDSLKPL
jgi:hypothetical protein